MDELKYNLLGKILAGEATAEEQAAFEEWLNQSQENRNIYEAYLNFYNNYSIKETSTLETRSIQRYLNKAPRKSNRIYWAAAAAIALLVVSVFFLLAPKQMAEPQLQSGLVIKSNPSGQKSRILLPDGSTVWLNSNSSIAYAETFADSVRNIRLTGEAYFDVVRDEEKPFIVEAGGLRTTVLGTSFNINNYQEEKTASVSLVSGKVKVEQDDHSAILTPGEQLTFDKSTEEMTAQSVAVEKIALWKSGILVFEQEDFQSVTRRLERWYDVNITVTGDPSPEWQFTGYFDNENLKNVLEVLCFGKKLNYKIEGNDVELIKQ